MDNKLPIESIMTTTMENIRDMVDVNTVIGDPVNTPASASWPAAENIPRANRWTRPILPFPLPAAPAQA